MIHPDYFIRIKDGVEFRNTHAKHTNPLQVSVSLLETHEDRLTWVSDTFYVSGKTGFAYRPK